LDKKRRIIHPVFIFFKWYKHMEENNRKKSFSEQSERKKKGKLLGRDVTGSAPSYTFSLW